MQLAEVVEQTIDLEQLLAIAQTAPDISGIDPLTKLPETDRVCEEKLRVGVAGDEAFCFLYEDNLRLLERLGAEIIPFSPIRDKQIPRDLDGLIFYGGYPELYAAALSANKTMIASIRRADADGIPILAECGGFMYLGESMEDIDGQVYPMVGLTEGKAYRTGKLVRFGYVDLTASQTSSGFFDGYEDIGILKAHEFHYYDTTDNGCAFHAQKPAGKRNWDCLISRQNLLVGFPHIYYYANPKFAQIFLDKCRRRKHL